MGALYQIAFPNGKRYIGVCKGLARHRFAQHKWNANNGSKFALHNAIRKYGHENAVVKILAFGEWNYLLEIEQKAIAKYGTKSPNGYNMTDGGDGIRGLTEEARKKISDANIGKTLSVEHRAAVARAQTGRKHTPEHCAKTGAVHIGRKKSAEAIAKQIATRRAKYNGAYRAS